ncbi:hypothetical protein EV702DRAFT_1192958 [Suillus placidus]|uniref:Uncharacterized protein n=1 Tax=Suillus placidus TaxID=48579 RepID=A0A9P7A474_9AGAM|nr:hypothetical protein EV702DRAFT_1192958 [Suillus placidus]
MPSPTAMLTPMYPPLSQGIDLCCFLPSPAPTQTLTQENPSVIPTARWRSHCHTEDDNDLPYPPKKLCIATDILQSTLAAGGEPPETGFDPNLPRVANDNDCNYGARRLQIHAAQVAAHSAAINNVLRPREEEEDWEADQMDVEEEGEVHDAGDWEQAVSCPQTQQRGAWCRHPLDNPKISCSDQAVTIIAELAAACCLSSIHDPLQ